MLQEYSADFRLTTKSHPYDLAVAYLTGRKPEDYESRPFVSSVLVLLGPALEWRVERSLNSIDSKSINLLLFSLNTHVDQILERLSGTPLRSETRDGGGLEGYVDYSSYGCLELDFQQAYGIRALMLHMPQAKSRRCRRDFIKEK